MAADHYLPDAAYNRLVSALADLDCDPSHPHPMSDRIRVTLGEIGSIWPLSCFAAQQETAA